MVLLTNRIRLGQPGRELWIDLTRRSDAETMNMVARRDGVNAAKTRVLEAACQDDMSVQPF